MTLRRRIGVDSVVLSYSLFALALIVGPQAIGLRWLPLARSITACLLAASSLGIALASWRTQGKSNYAWTYLLWVPLVIGQDFFAAIRSGGLANPDWPGVIQFNPIGFVLLACSIVSAFVDLVNLIDGLRKRSRRAAADPGEHDVDDG